MYFYKGLGLLTFAFILFLIHDIYYEVEQDEAFNKLYKEHSIESQKNREIKLESLTINYQENSKIDKNDNIKTIDNKIIEKKSISEIKTSSGFKLKDEIERVEDYHIISTSNYDKYDVEVVSNMEIDENPDMFPMIPTLINFNIENSDFPVIIPTELINQNGDIAIRVSDKNGKILDIRRVEGNNINMPTIPTEF